MKIQKQTAEKYAEEISNRMVDYCHDLFIAEQEENFEQAALIQTALLLFITNASQLLAEMTNGSTTQIFEGLKENSEWIFEEMKKNKNNIDNL